MLTVLCSAKGSPGVTSAGLALAAAWPHQVVLVEADTAGGDLAIRTRTTDGQALPETPTIATVAAAARAAGPDTDVVSQYAHALNDVIRLVPGIASAEASAGMTGLWDVLASGLRSPQIDILADVGRLHSGAPAMRLVEAADVVAIVVRAEVSGVVHFRERIRNLADTFTGRRPILVPLIVSTARHATRNVADVVEILDAERLATAEPVYVAWDPAALARLEGGEPPQGRLAKTALVRSAQQAADRLRSISSAAQEANTA